jgi:hypothetical protein
MAVPFAISFHRLEEFNPIFARTAALDGPAPIPRGAGNLDEFRKVLVSVQPATGPARTAGLTTLQFATTRKLPAEHGASIASP